MNRLFVSRHCLGACRTFFALISQPAIQKTVLHAAQPTSVQMLIIVMQLISTATAS